MTMNTSSAGGAMVITGGAGAAGGAGGAGGPPSTPSQANGPVVGLTQDIPLLITGLDPSQTGNIHCELVAATTTGTGEPTDRPHVSIQLTGLQHAIDMDGRPVPASRRTCDFRVDLTGDPAADQVTEGQIVAALAILQQGANLLRGSYNNRATFRQAEERLAEGFQALGVIHRCVVTAQDVTQRDPRSQAIAEAVRLRPDLEQLNDYLVANADPLQNIVDIATGTETISVNIRSDQPQPAVLEPGNAARAEFNISVCGIEVTIDAGTVAEGQVRETLHVYLDEFRALPLNNANCMARECQRIQSRCQELLPHPTSNTISQTLLGSDPAWAGLQHGALGGVVHLTFEQRGYIAEELDPLGCELHADVRDGVLQLRGRLLDGSVIRVRPGATLMLDAEAGSNFTLIIEEGGKVMSGPAEIGISGCTVHGEIHGDASLLHMQKVTWGNGTDGNPMTVESFRNMVFDTNLVDATSRLPFAQQSTAYTGFEALTEADYQNLSRGEMFALLSENGFAPKDLPDGRFIVEGAQPNRAMVVSGWANNTGVRVTPLMGGNPNTPLMGLRDDEILRRATQAFDASTEFTRPHEALREILRSRMESVPPATQPQRRGNGLQQVVTRPTP